MPRKKRIHYRNAFYHIMLRGNNRQNIFYNNHDFQGFMNILNKAAVNFCFTVHLYCLMTNHIHLVIEVSDIPISKIMQCISSAYTKLFNQRHERIGHLFQGRFKSIIIQNDGYLIELCYYIHMNPIKAGMTNSLDDYQWSSHLNYSENRFSELITTKHIKELISERFEFKEMVYQNFMMTYKENPPQPSYCTLNEDGILIFKDSVIAKMNNKPYLDLKNIPLRKIVQIICDYLDVEINALSSGSQARKITLARSMITYFSHYHAKYLLEDIAAYFCLQANSISKTLQRHLSQAKQDKSIQQLIDAVERRLSMSDADS